MASPFANPVVRALAVVLAVLILVGGGLLIWSLVSARGGPSCPSGYVWDQNQLRCVQQTAGPGGPGSNPTPGPGSPSPTNPTPGPVPTPNPANPPGSGSARNLGLVPIDLASPPSSAGSAETLVLHGDVDHSGRCSVRVFGPNQRTAVVSGGIFRVVSLTGSPESNGDAIRRIQAAAAADAGTDCPLR